MSQLAERPLEQTTAPASATAPTAEPAAPAAEPPAPRRTSFDRRMRRYQVLVVLADAFVLLVTARVAGLGREMLDVWLVDSMAELAEWHPLTPLLFGSWLLALALTGAYDLKTFGGGQEEFRRVAMATGLAAGAFCTVAFFVRTPLSRGYILISFALGTVLLLAARYAVRKLLHSSRQRGHLRARVLVVGNADAMREVVTLLDRMSWTGLEVVAGCVPGPVSVDEQLPVPLICADGDIAAACEQAGADLVLVTGGHGSSRALRRIGWQLEGTDIDLLVVPSLIDVAGPRILMRQVGGLPLIHIDKPSVGRRGGAGKRVFDLVVASAMLAVLAVPMLVIALLIKLQDGGPVLYRQQRTGRDDEPFWMLKFRSMVVDADQRLDELQHLNEADEVLFKVKDDPRITRLGRFIRRTSIDELPQLFNVLRGEMSIVGPRPPLPEEVVHYPDDMRRRLLLRPGLTGLWQVSGRSDLPFDEAVRMDLYYVDNWSLVGDVIIVLKTVRAVVSGSGAY